MKQPKEIIGHPMYLIYEDGRVFSKKRRKFLKHEKIKKGHHRVRLDKKHLMVHRLVAINFIPNPKNYLFVCHKDSNPDNNCLENLRWDDAFGNMADRKARGLYKQIGEKNYGSKLKEKDVIKIRELLASGIKHSAVSKLFKKISTATIYDIDKRRSWNHV